MKVLAIAAGILLLLVFFCCGVGALFTSTKPSPRLSDAVTDKGTSHDAETQHTNPAESRDPDKGLASAKVDRILSARTAKYEQQLAAWEEAAAGRQKAESALTQARSKLEAMEKNKP